MLRPRRETREEKGSEQGVETMARRRNAEFGRESGNGIEPHGVDIQFLLLRKWLRVRRDRPNFCELFRHLF